METTAHLALNADPIPVRQDVDCASTQAECLGDPSPRASTRSSLSMASADDPMSACLVGILFSLEHYSLQLRTLTHNINTEPPLIYKHYVPITNPLLLRNDLPSCQN